jgi:integrase
MAAINPIQCRKLLSYEDMRKSMVKLTDTDDGGSGRKRAWLSQNELRSLYESADDMAAEIAFRLMGEGNLRSAEVLDVCIEHVERMETDDERYKLIVPNGKMGKRRETVISSTLHTKMTAYGQANGLSEDEPLISVTKRTLQNWMRKACEKQEGDSWEHVSCHDLRRSAIQGYLEGGANVQTAMQLAGHEDYETFRDHYLGTLSDDAIAQQTATFFA